jgi:hypothetical protein
MRGKATELWLADWLRRRGWSVQIAAATRTAYRVGSKMIYRTSEHDMWGAWDIVGFHRSYGWLLAQTTTPTGVAKRKRKCAPFAEKVPLLGRLTNLWVCSDDRRVGAKRGRLRVWEFCDGGWRELPDTLSKQGKTTYDPFEFEI